MFGSLKVVGRQLSFACHSMVIRLSFIVIRQKPDKFDCIGNSKSCSDDIMVDQ